MVTALDAMRPTMPPRLPARAGSFSGTLQKFFCLAKLGRYQSMADIKKPFPINLAEFAEIRTPA
jgi:hypothetical protein